MTTTPKSAEKTEAANQQAAAASGLGAAAYAPPPADAETVEGQNPYTDPPPMSRRRFYEDPVPLYAATEQQVLQGRGQPAPYPADAAPERAWSPNRYEDQKAMPRPADSPQPSEYESRDFTVAELLSLPRHQQDKILEDMRRSRSGNQQQNPGAPTAANAKPNPQQGDGSGVQSMAPASPGTMTASEEPDEPEKPATSKK
jgi:hypothetical protein